MTECAYTAENIRFWYDNPEVDDWTLSASTSAANHPITEIKLDAPTKTWRSTTNGISWIEGNYTGTVSGADSLVIVNSNFEDTLTPWKIEIWNNFGGLVHTQNFFPTNYLGPKSDAINKIRPYRNRVVHFTYANNMARWRITTPSRSSGYHEIGRVFVGRAFTPELNFLEKTGSLGGVDKTNVTESFGGQKSSNNRPKKRSVNLQFPTVGKVGDLGKWLEMTMVTGKRKSIFVDLNPIIPDRVFTASEAGSNEAILNLLWQMYGISENTMKFSPKTPAEVYVSGGIYIEEAL